jgi:hypothetical protein
MHCNARPFTPQVDALGRTRATSGDDRASRCLLTELLLQMNGLGADEGVYVFGATNRIADCDAALLRRFDRWGARLPPACFPKRLVVQHPDSCAAPYVLRRRTSSEGEQAGGRRGMWWSTDLERPCA